jgi:hypothetical protein
MGYTHYWTQKKDFTQVQWARLSCDVRDILIEARKHGIQTGDYAGGGLPQFEADRIAFNGLGEEAHETFYIDRKRERPDEYRRKCGIKTGWGFCKTARKPYDIVVTAVLIYLHTVWKFDVSSDGDYPDWVAGHTLVTKAIDNFCFVIPVPLVREEVA